MLSAKISGEFKHRGNPPHQFMRLDRLRKRIDLSNTNGDVRILAQASGLLCCHLQSILTLTLNPGGGGGYSHSLPIRVCAAQRGRDFEAPDLEGGIHFRGVF